MVERLHNSVELPRHFAAAALPEAQAPATRKELFTLVYRQMRALAGHRDVDELAQAAAEQALRALPSFTGRSKLSTWTFRICYWTIRKHDRWYHRWLRRFTLTAEGVLPEVVADASSADERLVQEERVRRLRVALDQLSHKRRTVVMLHDLEGLSIDEIAEVVDALPRAVRSRLRDGRTALAGILRADPYFGVEACHSEDPP
jgi:RNA polymerase sigma-70 factor, ECF subfamily